MTSKERKGHVDSAVRCIKMWMVAVVLYVCSTLLRLGHALTLHNSLEVKLQVTVIVGCLAGLCALYYHLKLFRLLTQSVELIDDGWVELPETPNGSDNVWLLYERDNGRRELVRAWHGLDNQWRRFACGPDPLKYKFIAWTDVQDRPMLPIRFGYRVTVKITKPKSAAAAFRSMYRSVKGI